MPVPPLCERCWFPVHPDEPVRRLVVREGDEAVLRGYEHAGTCTAQEPAIGDDVA
jgi:hypothetical protein